MRRKVRRYPEKTKMQAVAMLTAGIPAKRIAYETGVSITTLDNWKQRYQLDNEHLIDKEHRHKIGEMLTGFMGEVLETQASIQKMARETDWISRHSPEQAALFMRQSHEQFMQIAEAQMRAQQAQQQAVAQLPDEGGDYIDTEATYQD